MKRKRIWREMRKLSEEERMRRMSVMGRMRMRRMKMDENFERNNKFKCNITNRRDEKYSDY